MDGADEQSELHALEQVRALWGDEPCETRPTGLAAPRRVHVGARGVIWIASEARIAAELAAHEAARGCPLLPALLGATSRALWLEPLELCEDDPSEAHVSAVIDALDAARPSEVLEARMRARDFFALLRLPVNLGRALKKVGLSRSHIDRLLGLELDLATHVGPGLGGIDPGALGQRADGAWAALTFATASARSLHAQTLASAQVRWGTPLFYVHRAQLPAQEADAAYHLALIAQSASQAVLGEDPGALERIREAMAFLPGAPSAEPLGGVRVHVEAPHFFPIDRYTRGRTTMSAAEARFIARALDGLHVGGHQLHVRLEPPLRVGKAPPPREPLGERRHRLFSRWDEGIQVDDEGLFSATPERLAQQIAAGAQGVVIDATCGVGALSIALAAQRAVARVIAVDLDGTRLRMAEHNARIYGVRDRIEFVHGDAADVIAARDADLVVIDPPWGGRDYDRERMTLQDLGMDLRAILSSYEAALTLKLPRSFDVRELPPGFSIEVGIDERGVVKMLIARRARSSMPTPRELRAARG